MSARRQQSGQSSQVLIVIVLGVILLAVVCVAVYLLFFQGDRSGVVQSIPQPELDIPTAREAYVAAVDVVRQTDQGAQLASGVGAWTPTIAQNNLDAGRTGWTFHFYMPTTSTIAWVVVSRGGGARVTRVDDWETPPSLLDDQSWQIDSGQAVLTAMQTCQPTLDAHPDATIEARLSLAAANRALVWRISVTPADPGVSPCVVSMDATTGSAR
jgi:hypothetical protein